MVGDLVGFDGRMHSALPRTSMHSRPGGHGLGRHGLSGAARVGDYKARENVDYRQHKLLSLKAGFTHTPRNFSYCQPSLRGRL